MKEIRKKQQKLQWQKKEITYNGKNYLNVNNLDRIRLYNEQKTKYER